MESLTRQPPEIALKHLQGYTHTQPPVGFNWHTMASGARTMVQLQADSRNRQQALGWMRVAVLAYGQTRQREPDFSAEVDMSVMLLRVMLLKTWGTDPDEPLLDPSPVVTWILEGLPSDTEAFLDEQGPLTWMDAAHARILDRLEIARGMMALDLFPQPARIHGWLARVAVT